MKTKFTFQFILLLTFGFFVSCDLIDKADDVSFDTTQTVSFLINETASNPSGKSFSDTKVLNVASDPDVAKYASKLKEFKVNKITYTISGANPSSVNFTNGKIVTSAGKTIASASSIPLTTTSETQLTSDNSGINDLTASLLSNKQEQITLSGNLSSTPVTFTVNIKFYLTITANALD